MTTTLYIKEHNGSVFRHLRPRQYQYAAQDHDRDNHSRAHRIVDHADAHQKIRKAENRDSHPGHQPGIERRHIFRPLQ